MSDKRLKNIDLPRKKVQGERGSRRKSLLTVMALLLAVMLTSGCFDYREEIWFNNDLSGTISIDLAIGELYIDYATEVGLKDDVFTADGLAEIAGGIVGVTLINSDVYTAEENRTIKLSLKFDSIDALKRIYNSIEGIDFLGEISLTDAPNGQSEFKRMVSLTDPRIKSIASFDENINNRFWVSKIHFPGAVNKTNAPEENIDARTRQVVIWGYSIYVLTQGERSVEATFSQPNKIVLGPIAVAGVVFVLVVVLMYKLLKPGGTKVKREAVEE